MYVGRFVLAGRTTAGVPFLGYRVSSRSFPDRRIVLGADRAAVLPTASARATDNPYIAYNCYRRTENAAIVTNGSHTDPIVEKLAAGYPLRDALALTLLALDYEHDSLNTPRIAAGWAGDIACLAIVTEGGLCVWRVAPEPGTALLVATYDQTEPLSIEMTAGSGDDLAQQVFGLPYEHPVAAFAALLGDPVQAAAFSAHAD